MALRISPIDSAEVAPRGLARHKHEVRLPGASDALGAVLKLRVEGVAFFMVRLVDLVPTVQPELTEIGGGFRKLCGLRVGGVAEGHRSGTGSRVGSALGFGTHTHVS